MSGTVLEVTRGILRDVGLTTIFGNPGSTELPFLADLPADFRYVLALQESCAVAMADAYAQFTGNAALINLHSAGGVGHALGNVATAHRNHSPLVIVAGQQVRSLLRGEPFLGAPDATAFPRPYVKWAAEPAQAADVPAAIARAYLVATTAPYGPTFVSVPVDDWDAPAAPAAARARIPGSAPDPATLSQLAQALSSATAPAIVVGPTVDASGAADDVVRLAERTGAAVWVSPMSHRCSFPENHRLFAGFLPPAREHLTGALSRYDLVVVLGAPVFTYHVGTAHDGGVLPELYVVNDEEQALAWAETGIAVRADLGIAVRQLLDSVPPTGRPGPPARPGPATPPATTPMSGRYVYSTLATVLPADAVVVEEAPSHRNDLHTYLPIPRPGGFLTMASGVLGFGLPAAVGVALAQPDRPVIAVIGDGSAMYGIQGLWTAARENAPVAFVILDNGGYGALTALARASGIEKFPGAELGGIDFCAVARGMGCPARLVESPADLVPALREAIAADGPMLLHVRVDPDVAPLYG